MKMIVFSIICLVAILGNADERQLSGLFPGSVRVIETLYIGGQSCEVQHLGKFIRAIEGSTKIEKCYSDLKLVFSENEATFIDSYQLERVDKNGDCHFHRVSGDGRILCVNAN